MQFRFPLSSPMTRSALHLALIAAACFLVYSNNYHHDYHLDSTHTISDNTSIRTLKNLPLYFSDPSHFSSLRSNVDYRPVLVVTYALNYWMGAYDTWWWHFTQILIHFWCAAGLYFLAASALRLQWPQLGARAVSGISLLTALLFSVHPTGSGVVNYLSARSSALTAALLLTSLVLYFRGTRRREGHPQLRSALFFGLALFTKVEALACLAVFFLYEVLRRWNAREVKEEIFRDFLAAFDRPTLRHLWPHLALGGFYLAVRSSVMAPYNFAEFSRSADVGPVSYSLTQLTALWHYVLNWFGPVKLVADDLTFPVYHSLAEAPVLLAVAGWLLVLTVLVLCWKVYAPLVFLAFSAYVLITPTSSVVPLSEMVNEHRPYLPLAVLSLVWVLPAACSSLAAFSRRRFLAVPFGLAVLLILNSFAVLTYERNRVFATSRSYWEDVVRKAPSSRAYLNYGLTYLAEANWPRAEALFLRSLELAPYWPYTHINLALVYENTGRDRLALDHYYKAVQFDQSGSIALVYRGEYYLKTAQYERAMADFRRASETSLDRFRISRGLARASAGLGDAAASVRYTRECLQIDREQTAMEIVKISRPFWESPDRYQAGLSYYRTLAEDLPDAWWVQYNIGDLLSRLGDDEGAREAFTRSEALRVQLE